MSAPTTPFLRRATPSDAAVALSWSPNLDSLKRWAGPSARWPDHATMFWSDLTQGDFVTFALESSADGVVGFGQLKLREPDFAHLARIVVDPRRRGQGYGRMLCSSLMREAPGLFRIAGYSLFVYRDNPVAIALYASLGFSMQGAHPRYPEIELMTAPLHAGGS
ncbi:MAG: GNAT family N-acetyltransferase [Verrucomicrobia bacterium]|nr:GNAT family N-acetyltransferase [Verrucomicrobiota bacterium]